MRITLFRIILILIIVCSFSAVYSDLYLGVYLSEYENANNQELPKYGLKVHNVILDSPANEADLRKNDILLEVEKEKLTNIDQLVEILKEYKTGDSIAIKYFRDNKIYNTKLKLTAKTEPDLSNIENRIEEMIDRSKTLIFRYESEDDNVIGVEISPGNSDNNRHGALITKVIPNSPADKAKLQKDDVIIRIEGKDIKDSVDLVKAIQTTEVGKTVTVEFYRKSKLMKTQVEIVKRKSIK